LNFVLQNFELMNYWIVTRWLLLCVVGMGIYLPSSIAVHRLRTHAAEVQFVPKEHRVHLAKIQRHKVRVYKRLRQLHKKVKRALSPSSSNSYREGVRLALMLVLVGVLLLILGLFLPIINWLANLLLSLGVLVLVVVLILYLLDMMA